jgi:hypothetical protein
MTTISATTNANNVYGVDSLTGASGLSPEALLAYCQNQLGGLDGEIRTAIKGQNLELQEREAAENVQGVLEQYGDSGPQDGPSMQKCVDALNQTIASLPQGDPVAAQLLKFENNMVSQYGFHAGTTLTAAETVDMQVVGTDDNGAPVYGNMGHGDGSTEVPPTMDTPPKDNDWKGTCSALDNIVGDIKSNAEIKMLSLQDLVSQRQQAVSLATSMMSKEDTSLEQLAHLGQG